ncbi:hypothetical protein [Bacillus massilinigeriensis]|uniref:hypothetical protein n=1 Tax=Bacillus massilionigeriensis TaxID=1805475 RepID=UPI00096AFA3B|nr:hypothetical protein [Bacillus massilionigeriensis]
MDKEIYPRYELGKLLNITYQTKLIHVLNEYNIKPISKDTHNIEYYKAVDVENLLKIQSELYEYYQGNFVTYDEGKKLGASAYDLTLSNPKELPIITRIKKFYKRNTVYEKNLLNEVLEKKALLNTTSYYTTKEVSQLFQIIHIEKLLKENNIEPIVIENKSGYFYRWDKKEINALLKKREDLYHHYDQNYLTYKEVSKLLNVKMISSHVIKKNNLVTEEIPSLIKFNRFTKTHVAFTKASIYEYLRIREKKKTEAVLKDKKSKKKNLNLKEKKANERSEILQEKNLKKEHIPLNDIGKVLGLSKALVVAVLQENDITPKHIINNEKWYPKGAIYKLKETQNSLYDKFEKECMTFIEVRSLNISTKAVQNFPVIDAPRIIKIKKFKNSKVVYPKNSVEEYMIQKRKEELQKDIIKDITIPFATFERLILALEVSFSSDAPLTQKYWFSYVRQILNNTKGNKQSVKKQVIRLVSISELLASITKSKEIFSYSARELNLLLFNHEVFQEYQITIYAFFNAINNEMPLPVIDLSKIKNPNEVKRRKKMSKKEVYSPTEFIQLLDYVKDVELHKQEAINDVHVALNKRNKYKKYDSAWLYVLLHMNNGWRSSDFAYNIPRLDLPEKINNISDFENIDLSSDDAKYMVIQLSSKLQSLKHSKNQKTNYFFCSDELIFPLANALIICELRTRLLGLNNQHLIDFMNEKNEMLKGTHDAFFANFKKNFKFGSLKMNRTFIGLMTDVVKKKTNRNPLEISKFIRNHSDLDTTNTYIDIPQEQLDYIASQLFDKGYFGYTYDLFTKVLLGSSSMHLDDSLNKSVLIKNIFGDIYEIENLARYINILEQEDEDLLHYLNGHSEKELQEKMLLLNLGQLPAKEANYQCIYGKCIFLERDCSRCPFAVPHFYALTKIAANMVKRLKEYRDIHDNSMYLGEKVRISNLLFSDLLVLSHAKQKFGEDVLSAFIKIDYNDLKEEISSLPSPYEYITIKRG